MKENEAKSAKRSRDNRQDRQKFSGDYRERKREEHRHRDDRTHRAFGKQHYYEERREARPEPVGTMCSPTCPLFRCARRALVLKLVDGKPVAYCTWVNDNCIGYKCQYSSCFQKYLLPDGKCLAVVKNEPQKEDMFMKELERDEENKNLKNLLSRKGFGKDLVF